MMETIGRIRATLRQLAFAPELRIEDPGVDPDLTLDELRELLGSDTGREPPAGDGDDSGFDRDFLRKLATTSWRLGRQVGSLADDGPGRRLRSRVEILGGLLDSLGVRVVDFSGKPYDENEIWDDVIASHEEKRNPVIVSMQEPRVFFRGALIQRGRPIVEEADGSHHDQGEAS